MKKIFSGIEKAFYETKPILFIGIGALVLVGTSWGLSTLILSLAIVVYAGAILFWRLEFRGSLKRLFPGTRPKNPTPSSNSDNDRSGQSS